MPLIITQQEKAIYSNVEFKGLTSGYTYHRVCKLAECTTEIYTNRKDHFYCNGDHHDEFWRREKTKTSNVNEKIRKIETEIKEIKERVENLESKGSP